MHAQDQPLPNRQPSQRCLIGCFDVRMAVLADQLKRRVVAACQTFQHTVIAIVGPLPLQLPMLRNEFSQGHDVQPDAQGSSTLIINDGGGAVWAMHQQLLPQALHGIRSGRGIELKPLG